MNSPFLIRLRRVAAAALCSGLLVAIAATPSGATIKPDTGSTFESGDEGWTSAESACSLLGGGELLCDASAERVADGGNPGGALRARSTVLANAAGLFTAQHVFRSPTFTLEDRPFDAVFSYDRRFLPGALVALGVGAEASVILVDETKGKETLLLEDPLGADDREYATRIVGVQAGALQQKGSYHLEIRVSTRSTSTQAEALGSTDVLVDNPRLVISDRSSDAANGGNGGANGGGAGNGGDSALGAGLAPGGSATQLRKCTIIGTEGDDRITGTQKADIICALGGDDVVKGLGGRDVIDAANGDDRANGGKKTDLLLGLAGADRLKGATGGDKLAGGKGRDVLAGGAHNDNISARDGERDVVNGGSGKRNRARTDSKDTIKRVQRLLPR